MGAILEPTPAMGPWRVEARSTSAYLAGAPMRGHRPAEPIPDGMNALGFAVHRAGLPSLLAAIDQMIDHTTEYDLTPDDLWTGHTLAGDWVQFHGPVYVYGLHELAGGAPWVDTEIIEFNYHDLGGLRDLVDKAIG